MISDYHYSIIMKHADRLNSAIIYDRDFSYNYFGFKVLHCTFKSCESYVNCYCFRLLRGLTC